VKQSVGLTNEAVTAAKTTRKIIKDVLANIPKKQFLRRFSTAGQTKNFIIVN